MIKKTSLYIDVVLLQELKILVVSNPQIYPKTNDFIIAAIKEKLQKEKNV